VPTRAARNQKRLTIRRQLADKETIKSGVLGGFEHAATVPRLISNAPEPHIERFGIAIGGPLAGKIDGPGGRIAV
jgi:hypothetical protein